MPPQFTCAFHTQYLHPPPPLQTDFESIQPPCLYIPIPPQADLEACRVSRQEANRGPSRAPPRRRASSVLEGIATFLSATLLLAILVSLVWFDDRKVFLTVFGAFAAIGLYTTLVYFACEFMDRWVAKCREADPLDSGIV